jgi:3-hydroxyacyl-CoA dehydrogenase
MMMPRAATRAATRRLFSSEAHVIQRVGVVGLGLMGHGIVQNAAEKGFAVVAVEQEQKFLDGGMARIKGSVEKLAAKAVSKGKLTEAQAAEGTAATLGRITPGLGIEALAECDIVVEAVIEDLKLKEALYGSLGHVCLPECILASNTSSLSIGTMAAYCGRPSHMIGLHFFNPVQLMQLVEVVRTDATDPAVFGRAMAFARALGKTPVDCIDTPGFVVNRLLVPFLIEAILLVERGTASPSDVDVAMKLGAGHPMGPIHLADYIGLDTILSIIAGWQEAHPADGFVVPASLRAKVSEGKLGRKSGEGFYKWNGDKLA